MSYTINAVAGDQTIDVESGSKAISIINTSQVINVLTPGVPGSPSIITTEQIVVVDSSSKMVSVLSSPNIIEIFTTGGPGGGGSGPPFHEIQSIPWTGEGPVAVSSGDIWVAPWDGDFVKVILLEDVSPGMGDTCVVDITKEGVTIFTDPDNRPHLDDVEVYAEFTVFDVGSFSEGDKIQPAVVDAAGEGLDIQLHVLPS